MELRQLFKAGQRRLRWGLPDGELVASDVADVSSDHA